MYRIELYKKKNDECPVGDYLNSLSKAKDKDSRIKLNKLTQYVDMLSKLGTRIGEPIVKHLEDDIWELRPSGNRVLFAAVIDNCFVLLHVFRKQTQKTPRSEIELAKRELEDYKNRREEP